MSDEQRTLILFGRDLLKIPCFRNTFLYAISSYLGVGFLTFLVTSRAQFSSHCGFASYVVVGTSYYTYCALKNAHKAYVANQIKELMRQGTLSQGLKVRQPDEKKEKQNEPEIFEV